mmetsp:Transcript_1424/g.1522  ORF Transcript_1424/g.1522 Transcript_1424/m.1522 type:complete len:184 (+) Transcript_1424:74-625(+)
MLEPVGDITIFQTTRNENETTATPPEEEKEEEESTDTNDHHCARFYQLHRDTAWSQADDHDHCHHRSSFQEKSACLCPFPDTTTGEEQQIRRVYWNDRVTASIYGTTTNNNKCDEDDTTLFHKPPASLKDQPQCLLLCQLDPCCAAWSVDESSNSIAAASGSSCHLRSIQEETLLNFIGMMHS